MIARRYVLKGRVQGVGFRYFTYRQAEELGVEGWVRNLPNGDVEIHAQGDEQTLRRFLQRIRTGPSLAVVQDLEIQDVPPEPCHGFSIER